MLSECTAWQDGGNALPFAAGRAKVSKNLQTMRIQKTAGKRVSSVRRSPLRASILPALLLFTLLSCPLHAQRFRAGIVAGLTASQIDGDRSAGYNKLGFQGGLRATANLGGPLDGSMELLFSQRGAQSRLVQDENDVEYFSLTLNYVEVPVQLHYHTWPVEDDEDGFYRASFNAGLSYARYLGYKIPPGDFSAFTLVVPDKINKNDLSFSLGASVFTSRHLGFTIRYVRSVLLLYDPQDHQIAPFQEPLSPHSLYFQAAYLF
jgi:hypothetical protein